MMTAVEIKHRLSMLEMAVRYGFMPDRSNRILCPFHDDNNPSLYMYDEPGQGFYCFSCGAGGSVIDFVMRLFQLEFKQAVLRISMDFGYSGMPIDRQAQQRILTAQAERQERKQAIRAAERKVLAWLRILQYAYDYLEPYSDYWCLAAEWIPKLDYIVFEV